MVTGSHAESDLQVAFASGAWDYITKPVSKAVLLARVHSALRLKHEMDRRQARELELLEVKAQLEAANETLRVLACLDSVTGLTNRRHFDHVLAQEWNRALRHGYPLGLLLIDVDHFKGFNDFWGHPAGDACLRRIADTLSPLTQRAGDVLARYGGDELVALLVDTDEQGACTVAGRMLHEVRVQQVEHPASPVAPYVTLSIGAASIRPARQAAPDVLVAAADGALYEAKRRGRDQVARQAPLGAPGADLDLPALAAG